MTFLPAFIERVPRGRTPAMPRSNPERLANWWAQYARRAAHERIESYEDYARGEIESARDTRDNDLTDYG